MQIKIHKPHRTQILSWSETSLVCFYSSLWLNHVPSVPGWFIKLQMICNKWAECNIKAELFRCDPSMSHKCLKVKKVQTYWKDMDQIISKIHKIFLSDENIASTHIVAFSLKNRHFLCSRKVWCTPKLIDWQRQEKRWYRKWVKNLFEGGKNNLNNWLNAAFLILKYTDFCLLNTGTCMSPALYLRSLLSIDGLQHHDSQQLPDSYPLQ